MRGKVARNCEFSYKLDEEGARRTGDELRGAKPVVKVVVRE